MIAYHRLSRRGRYVQALINELVEAKHQLHLGRAMARWARYDPIALDEVGYVRLAEVGAEFLLQVVAERAEKAEVIVTTNLPFSEWTQVIPNAPWRREDSPPAVPLTPSRAARAFSDLTSPEMSESNHRLHAR
jgi:hypothetical protein